LKKIIMSSLVCCLAVSVGMSSISSFPATLVNSRFPRTFEDYYLEKATGLTMLDAATIYTIERCKIEGVDPLQMLAILQVENPKHRTNALNINYKREWSKKKYVQVEDSRDVGLFQLNSKCFPDFIHFYWNKYGETEEFNPKNPQHNTRVAVRLHKANYEQFNGSVYYAVLAYNAGSGNVRRDTVPVKTSQEYWPAYLKYYTIMKER